jgi:DNA-binding MarR family transcriptional regulator
VIQLLDGYRRFRRSVNLLAVKELKPLGLGTKQASLIRHLGEQGRCSHADLARLTGTDPAATGRILDGLIRRGLVAREEHPSDRRRWVLTLSPTGRPLAAKIQAAFHGVAKKMAAPLSAQERDQLIRLLDKLSDALTPPTQGNDA